MVNAFSASYQPLVDLTTTQSGFSGRPCGCPRRTLPFCYVCPRQGDYVVIVHLRGPAADHEHDLTLHPPREVPGSLLDRPPEDLFVELRKLPAHGDRDSGRERAQCLPEPVRGLEEHEGGGLGDNTLQ